MPGISAGTSVNVTINGVKNPAITTTTGGFEIYHMNGNTALAINRAVTGVGISALPANITIKSVAVLDHSQNAATDYTFELYLPAGDYDTTDRILLELPKQYDTNL
eukprot:CAMPEP_0168316814 /NCGR_PEP_ID=MMETSP0210-20121227/19438_1 /TAXON_ID=40633 /ORGANISM="Condylostoma magnum, Strain COL2" /LENGTH=105 /DNA_ID=CAMNT_0008304989 /DNA_START=3857 /DNA_END=4174 /DNA_ORIENTATION=-